jgi:poly-gamma-glutamate synthesis protein (capsule biosynthesis protein)
MLGRLVSREISQRAPESFWGDVRPLLTNADAVIANLECAITARTEPWLATSKLYHFGARPAAIDVLKAGNIRAVSLANNHSLDFGIEGLADTLALLDEAGIAHAGAGPDVGAARAPAFLDAGAIRIALFGVVDHEEPFAARAQRAGTAYLDLRAASDASVPSAESIEAARGEGAQLVVLASHLGPNMVTRPDERIRGYRQASLARGIDIVVGHSAHLFQGIERIGGKLIIHDAGDFLDDYVIDDRLHNDWSFVFVVDAEQENLVSLSLFPVILEFASVRLASPAEAAPLFDRMLSLSNELGTTLERKPDRLVLAFRA